jgi:uncharacterized protein (TIGR04222 family)
MLQALIAIPGNDFIVYFLIAATLSSLLLWGVNRISDSSRNYEAPFPTKLHPYTLALLRGGEKAVLETALFSLHQRGILNFNTAANGITQLEVNPDAGLPKHPIDREVYYFAPQPLPQFFRNPKFTAVLKPCINRLVHELEQYHLYRTLQPRLQWVRLIPWTIFVIGIVKLGFGIAKGKAVGFLIIALIVFFIVIKILVPSKLSLLGKEFLEALPTRFDWIRHKLDAPEQLRGIDPAFAIAALGVSVLAGSMLFDTFQQQLAPVTNNNSNFGIESDGGSDNDGGSSGGSDGGGGCGGCGGGGD